MADGLPGMIMTYVMRYVVSDDETPDESGLRNLLAEEEPRYDLREGELTFEGNALAGVTIHGRSDEAFEEAVAVLTGRVGRAADEETGAMVTRMLREASALVEVTLPLESDPGPALELLEPFWDVLEENYSGLVHAEGEGFYDQGELILEDPVEPQMPTS
ncbi:MAG: hypothetical protein WBX15_16990 [Thermoanaerobaculia bacterium]